MQINKQWLDRQLKKLHINSCVIDEVTKLKKQVEKLLTYRLSSSKWTLIEFFVLSIVIQITRELLNSHLYQFAINTNNYHLRSLNQNDVKRIIQKYYQYYYEKFSLLTQLSKSKGFIGAYPAIEWLELVTAVQKELYIPQEIILYKITNDTSYDLEVEIKSSGMIELIPQNMAEAIRFSHYDLDPLLGNEGIFPIQWCDLNQAAELLNCSPDQLIFECFQNEFGPYLKCGAFEITTQHTATVTLEAIAELSLPSYQYHYQGLVRLLKESASFSSIETSLKALYQDTDIYVGPGRDFTLVRLQPSVADAIRGINKFIKLNRGQKITRDHLIFITDELNQSKLKNRTLCIEVSHQADLEVDEQRKSMGKIVPKFEKHGHFFNIIYLNEHSHLKSSHGLIYINYLLDNPDRDITVLELYRIIYKPPPDQIKIEDYKQIYEETTSVDGHFEECIMTEDDRKRCEARKQDIDTELLKIDDQTSRKALNLLSEKEKLVNFLNVSTNKSGDIRKVVTELEKIRQNVSKAIHTAFDSIEKEMPQLKKYLKAFIRTKSSSWQYHLRDIP